MTKEGQKFGWKRKFLKLYFKKVIGKGGKS